MPASTNPTYTALVSLLPASTLPIIPSRLLSAADSLFSLSCQRASNLKPDEEIARAHVCAEIACLRLRAQLRLPNIKSGAGAPCRPGVYKKLLSFLESVLGDVDLLGTPRGRKTGEWGTPGTGTSRSTGGGTGVGRKRNVEALELDGDEAEEQVQTPSKRRRTYSMSTPTKSTGKKAATNGFAGKVIGTSNKSNKAGQAPADVLPAVRKLCKTFKTPEMVPHVYTGFCVVSELQNEAVDDEDGVTEGTVEKRLGLVISIYLLTLTRMQEGSMTEDVYDAISSRSIEMLDLRDSQQQIQAEIESWISRINDEEWTSLPGKGDDWWSSVPEDAIAPLKLSTIAAQGADVEALDEHATPRPSRRPQGGHRHRGLSRREELRKQLEEEDPDDVLLPGLGTMMNDAVDYFSDERTAEFEAWKADVLRRIDTMDKPRGSAKKGKARASAISATA